jgi:hypothetical protein
LERRLSRIREVQPIISRRHFMAHQQIYPESLGCGAVKLLLEHQLQFRQLPNSGSNATVAIAPLIAPNYPTLPVSLSLPLLQCCSTAACRATTALLTLFPLQLISGAGPLSSMQQLARHLISQGSYFTQMVFMQLPGRHHVMKRRPN